MSTLRCIAAEVRRALDSIPSRLLVIGLLFYHFVHDDQWPWWLPVAMLLVAAAIGAFLWWRTTRRRKR